jgi:hypothetical protein
MTFVFSTAAYESTASGTAAPSLGLPGATTAGPFYAPLDVTSALGVNAQSLSDFDAPRRVNMLVGGGELAALACATAAAFSALVVDLPPVRETFSTEAHVAWHWDLESQVNFVHLAPSVRDVASASRLFAAIDSIIATGDRAKALDSVYDTVEDLLISARFCAAQCILSAATQRLRDRSPLPQSVFMSMLAVTRPWRRELRHFREELAVAVSARFKSDPAAAPSELIMGLL